MRSLIIAAASLAALAIPQAAAAQTANPIQRVDIPPSKPPAVDPFVDPFVDPAVAAAAAAVGDTAPIDRATPPPAEVADAADAPEAEETVSTESVAKVDAIMEEMFGPSEEEQRAMAAKLYAEQYERDQLEAQRTATLNREARERVEAENARRLAEYRAEVERVNSEYEARLAAWRDRVARCEAGDETACGGGY